MKGFKYKWLNVSLTLLVTTALITSSLILGSPSLGQAKNDDLIRQKEAEIAELEKKYKESQENVKSIQSEITRLKNQEKTLQSEVAQLDLEIATTDAKISKQKEEIAITDALAYQASLELQEAEERVLEREELLKTRVRAMYESGGKVDYLEVLLGSSSFGEFVERLDFLALLVQQDNKIIEDFVQAKIEVEEKKEEIEAYLVQLEAQLDKLTAMIAEFEQQQKDKEVRIAQIAADRENLAEQEALEFAEATNLANQKAAAQKELEDLKWDGEFAWPVPDSKRITSYFGNRKDPFTGERKGHNGMDIGAPQGSTIVAAASGVVLVAEYLNGYGNTVIIEHGNGMRTLYGHIRNGGTVVSAGDRVERKQKIAEVGSTGRSTGPHLHFEVHKNGQLQDPLDYLKK